MANLRQELHAHVLTLIRVHNILQFRILLSLEEPEKKRLFLKNLEKDLQYKQFAQNLEGSKEDIATWLTQEQDTVRRQTEKALQ